MSTETEQQKCDRVEKAMETYFEATRAEFEEMLEAGIYEEDFLCTFIYKHVLDDKDVKKLGDERMSMSDIFNGRFNDQQADDFIRDICVGVNYDMGVMIFHLAFI